MFGFLGLRFRAPEPETLNPDSCCSFMGQQDALNTAGFRVQGLGDYIRKTSHWAAIRVEEAGSLGSGAQDLLGFRVYVGEP